MHKSEEFTLHHSYSTALHQNGNLYTQIVPYSVNIFPSNLLSFPPKKIQTKIVPQTNIFPSNFSLSPIFPLTQLAPPSTNRFLPLDNKNHQISSKSQLNFPTFATNPVKHPSFPHLQPAKAIKPLKVETRQKKTPFGFPKFEDFKVQSQKPAIKQNFRVPTLTIRPTLNVKRPIIKQVIVPTL